MTQRVAIISTAHWDGDPRLNRHVRYLVEVGHEAELLTFAGASRANSLLRALVAVARSDADVVVLPDPDLYLPGSILARLTRKVPVIDIHEDYAKAAMARPWVPDRARRLVSLLARLMVQAGRVVAGRVVVAAEELARPGDVLSLNVPDPASLRFTPHDGSGVLVCVGDLTVARGALKMVDLLGELEGDFRLRLIGSVGDEVSDLIRSRAAALGVSDRLEMTGRLDHNEAWGAAQGALAGLNLLTPVPAYRDAVATKLWEYLAVGLPPIVSDLPGQRRLVRQIDERLVCRSVADAASVVTILKNDPALRAQIANRGRELVEERWAQSRPDRAIQSVVSDP